MTVLCRWTALILAIAVLSGGNTTVVTAYDAQTGHQLAESLHLSGSPLGIEILSSDWPTDPSKDIVTLSTGGHVRRFHHLELAWQTESKSYPFSYQY
jgi:hypothetical protein